MVSPRVAIIAGVGPGTATYIAKRFASAYPVALLARNPHNYEPVADKITSNGGKAVGISADLASGESVRAAFEKIRAEIW